MHWPYLLEQVPLLLQQKQELLVKAYQIQPQIQRQLRPKQELRPPQAKEQRQQQEPQAFGLLVLASPDVQRFAPDMGTDFLERIGELTSAALSRLRPS